MNKLVILNDDFADLACDLRPGRTSIGRGADNTFPIDEDSVSTHHCEIMVARGEVRVRDLHSRNGSFIEDRRINDAVLRPGQVLRVGNVQLALETVSPEAPAKAGAPVIQNLRKAWTSGLASNRRTNLIVKAATGVMAGGLILFLSREFPYYPGTWPFLLMLAVLGLWCAAPFPAMVLALVAQLLPVAHQTTGMMAVVFLLFMVLLEPFSFLVVGGTAFLMAHPWLFWLLPAAPLVAGFRGIHRGAIAGGLACLLAVTVLVLGGHSGAGVLTAPASKEPLVTLQPGPVKSLRDFEWLAEHDSSASCLTGLFKAFGEHPVLLGQVLVWAAAGGLVGWLLQQKSNRHAPVRLVAVAGGGGLLLIGHLALWALLDKGGASSTAALLGIPLCIAVVGLAAPVLEITSKVLTVAGMPREQAGHGKTAGSSIASKEIPRDTWSDLAGVDDIRAEVQEALQSQFDEATRESLRKMSLPPARGFLLFGPPGTGKTKLAKIIAHEAGAAFFAVSGTEFTSKWFGESEANLRSIFDTACEERPAVLFFDELEAFLPKRTELSRSDAPEKGILATFLAYTDGMANLDGVFVVGATNHPGLIDPAALRPGRFDKLIYLSAPNAAARRAIFERYLADKPLAPGMDFGKLAARTERFTGADIEAVCREATVQALQREKAPRLGMSHLEEAILAAKPSVSLQMQREYEEMADKFCRRSRKAEQVEVVAKAALGWDDVAGLEEVKNTLRELIEMPLFHAEVFQQYGVKSPKGVLLYGPPGCGKTLLAKVISHECKAHFLHVKGPEVLRQIAGQSEARLRELFDRARENAPCVLFFDEIDALAGARGSADASGTQILTQFLTEMDGVEELKGVVVLAATNRPQILDAALLRSGRFDRVLYVPPLDQAGRAILFRHELRGKPVAADVDSEQLATLTEGRSAADIASICNLAALSAAKVAIRSGSDQRVTMARLREQIEQTPPSLTSANLSTYQTWREQVQKLV